MVKLTDAATVLTVRDVAVSTGYYKEAQHRLPIRGISAFSPLAASKAHPPNAAR
jgi:hypothetical protein